MALSTEAYEALQAIVGERNVTRDPAILDGYALQMLVELVRPNASHYMPRAGAIVMPGSTEEVQAIVKAANKYNFGVKPHGTGWYHWASPDVRPGQPLRRREGHRPARHAPHERHRDRREERHRHRRAVRHPRAAARRGHQAGLELQHHRRGLVLLRGRRHLRLLGHRGRHHVDGRQRRERPGHGMGHPQRRDRPQRLARLGRRLVLQRGPGPVACAASCAARSAAAAAWASTPSAPSVWPIGPAPPTGRCTGTVPAYRLPIDETFRVYTVAVPTWDAWTDLYYKIYDNEIGYTCTASTTWPAPSSLPRSGSCTTTPPSS